MKEYTRLRNAPLLRFIFPFITGIIFAYKYNVQLSDKLIFCNIIALILVTFFVLLIFCLYNNRLSGYIMQLLIAFFGFVYTGSAITSPIINNNQSFFTGTIIETPTVKTRSILLEVKLNKTNFRNKLLINTPSILLYTNKDTSILSSIEIGDKIAFNSIPEEIRNFGNPNEFNYKEYLKQKGTHYQCYVELENLKIEKNNKLLNINGLSNYLQKRIGEKLKKYPFSEDSYGLISAVILGDRNYMSDDLKQAYATAGAFHILAVSGLHIGIIYMFLNFILRFLDRVAKLRILKAIILLFIIWLYALLADLSPSVLRASLMFTFFTIGKLLKRETSFFNLMAASALIMLLINPLQLFDVGFQLSYLAVGGIVYFQPIFYNLVDFSNPIVDYFYKLFTVSLAAQLTTAPVIIYYFHQFPVFFWLTNLLAIPLIFLVLFISIFFLIIPQISFLLNSIGFTLNFFAYLTNGWMSLIEDIPGAVIKNIKLSDIAFILSYLILILSTLWLKQRKYIYSASILLCIIFLLTNNIIWNQKVLDNKKFVVYNTPKHSTMGIFISGNAEVYSSADEKSVKNIKKLCSNHWMEINCLDRIKIKNFNKKNRTEKIKNKTTSPETIVFTIGNTIRIVYAFNTRQNIFETKQINCDYLIIGDNLKPPPQRIDTKVIVIDSSNKKHISKKWKSYGKENQISIVDVATDGAFVVDI